MEWADLRAGRLDSRTKATGDLRPVRFNTAAPWLMTLAAWLPWREDPADPAHRTQRLDYAPFAAIMWSFFLQEDSISNNEVPICNHILAPHECDEVLKKFEATGFTNEGSSFATLTIAIQTYATQERFGESFLDSSKHLESIDPGPTSPYPEGQYAYARSANVCELSHEFSNSYRPMALFELYTAPRTTVASRFEATMSFMHIVRAIHRAFVKHQADVQDQLDNGGDPEDTPLKETLQGHFANFSRASGMPMVVPAGAYDKTCTRRSALFGVIISWRFFPSFREATMDNYFTTMGESYTEVAPVTLPAPSAAISQVSTGQLATALSVTGPTTEVAIVPFIIPALWEVILDRLFAYTPGNTWMVTFNPHEQRLEGTIAQTFLHCREVCAAFDDYMLRYMARFTMQPVRYMSANETEIEFEQR